MWVARLKKKKKELDASRYGRRRGKGKGVAREGLHVCGDAI